MDRKICCCKIISLTFLPVILFSQYSEQTFAPRLWLMGNLSFIIKDPATTFNIYALDENPVDMLDYYQGNDLYQFINLIDYQRFYKGSLVNYTTPGVNFLKKIANNLCLGMIFSSRTIPHYYVVGISDKLRFVILTNFRLGRFYFGYKNQIKTLSYYSYHYISQEPSILLGLGRVKLGIGYNWQARYDYYDYGPPFNNPVETSFEIPLYFICNLPNTEVFSIMRYYSDRPRGGTKLNAYDIGNTIINTSSIGGIDLRLGLKMAYRRLNEIRFDMSTISKKFVYIIPGLSFDTKPFTMGIELPVLNSSFYKKNWFLRPQLGFELGLVKRIKLQAGFGMVEEVEILSPEGLALYGIKPFPYATPWPGTYYSFGFTYLPNLSLRIEGGLCLSYFPRELIKIKQILSFKWQL